MVRFIEYWIERLMETPEHREERARKHFEKTLIEAQRMRERWALPGKPAGYWNSRQARSTTEQKDAQRAAVSISPYEMALGDMDAAKKAVEEQ